MGKSNGLVSQVLDTILHVEAGKYNGSNLEPVKPPSGMGKLPRPVIEVVEFPSDKITHEMFAFGSEIAVVPVDGQSGSKYWVLAKDALQNNRGGLAWVTDISLLQTQMLMSTFHQIWYLPRWQRWFKYSSVTGRTRRNFHFIKTFDEMPDGLERPNPYWEDVQDQRSRASRAGKFW